FNGDGKLDLVTANVQDDSVSVLLGKGDGTFQKAVAYAAGTLPVGVAVADFNKDGRPDLVVSNAGLVEDAHAGAGNILLNQGDGTFGAPVRFGAGATTSALAVGDMNHDGRADLVTVNGGNNTVSVRLSNGDGTFDDLVPTYPTGPNPTSVAVGDFD